MVRLIVLLIFAVLAMALGFRSTIITASMTAQLNVGRKTEEQVWAVISWCFIALRRDFQRKFP